MWPCKRNSFNGKASWPADLVIDWLVATQDLKDIRLARRASANWARLLARNLECSAASMLEKLQQVSRTTIVEARTRFDIMSMNVFRQLWASLNEACFSICVYIDGSPQ